LQKSDEPLRLLAGVGQLRLGMNVLVLSLTSFATSFSMGLWLWYFSLYAVEEVGASSVELGLIFLVSTLCFFFGGFLGFLADSVGRKNVIVVGTSLYSLLTLAMGLSKSWITLALSLAGIRLIHSCYFGSMLAMTAESVDPSRRGMALSMLNLLSFAGLVPAPYVGSWLHAFYGSYQQLFAVSAMLTSLMAVSRLILRETLPLESRGKPSLRSIKLKMLDALSSSRDLKGVLVLSGLYSFSSSLTMGIYGLWILYATEVAGLSTEELGLWGAIYQAAFMLTVLPAGRLADKVGFKKMLFIGIPVEALSCLAFAYARGLPLVASVSIFDAVGSAMNIIALEVAVAHLSDSAHRAGALSLYSAAYYGSSAPASYVGGHIYSYSKSMPFILSASLQTLSIATLIVLSRGSRLRLQALEKAK